MKAEDGIKGCFCLFRWETELEKAFAHVAQLAEHILGKDEVTGSSPVMGSRFGASSALREKTNINN